MLSSSSSRLPLATPGPFLSLGISVGDGHWRSYRLQLRCGWLCLLSWETGAEPRGVEERPRFSTLPWQPWSSPPPAFFLFTGLFCSVPITFSRGCLILSFLSPHFPARDPVTPQFPHLMKNDDNPGSEPLLLLGHPPLSHRLLQAPPLPWSGGTSGFTVTPPRRDHE